MDLAAVDPEVKLSILDLAPIRRGETAAESFAASVALAQAAERLGYTRVWYAEHHNMPSIASSATSVLIAHVAAHTTSIRLGAGGIMLPNHAPLMIAEQFGTLESLHPGRIDLGLGRAPGTDQVTMRALRRGLGSVDQFPQDVLELQGYLADESELPGVNATPGRGTHVPLYILGSSLFGAQLAAALGLPYAFASHFAPAALLQAVEVYRQEFRPSAQLASPYLITAMNVIASESAEDAAAQLVTAKRARIGALLARGQELSDEQADRLLASPQGQHIEQMLVYSAIGTPETVRDGIARFAELSQADEVMVVHQSPTSAARLHSVELVADAVQLRAGD